MMGHKVIKFEGLIELDKALKERLNMDHVKAVVRENGDEMVKLAHKNASVAFVKGYTKGTTRQATNVEYIDDGLTAVVEPKTNYAAYVELGTRRMEAEPFLKPAWETQKEQFLTDMKKLIK